MKSYLYLLTLFLLSHLSFSQSFEITGSVKDSATGETLPGASIYSLDKKYGTMADFDGNYKLELKEGTYTLECYFFGYKSAQKTITVDSNQEVNFFLSNATKRIDEIVLTGKRTNENVEDTKVSTIELDVEEIKKLPALFGEVDVIKSIQLLPGVQVAGEGNAGLYVRGGGPDQNLVLLDNATVYNPVHTVGIFSVFNSDILGSTELYKGGIPAPYGGRLSSLLDIRTKDGDYEKFGVSGGIGLLASRLMVKGPIAKDKASFFVSARRTYFDYFLRLSPDDNINQTRLYFLDLNGKVSYKINKKNTLSISGYFGKDELSLSHLFSNDYGNATATASLKHVFNEGFYSETILTYSKFDYNIGINLDPQTMEISNGIDDFTLKQVFHKDLNENNALTFGVEGSYKAFKPGEIIPGSENSIFEPFKVPEQYSLDEALFISNKHKVFEKLTLDYGLRFSIFSLVGPGEVVEYAGQPSEYNITDTVNYDSFDFIKTYTGIEPRLSGRYLLNDNSSIKASYNRMFQYLHLLSNTTSPVPSNIWVPSSEYIKPEVADQVAVGYFRNFKDNTFEASIEGYYKVMNNVVDFVDDAEIFLNKTPETEVKAGTGRSYGAEFFLRKQKGKTTGWISYTLSKATRQIDGINEGKRYVASYDRRHNLNIVLSHDISEKINLSSTFVYGTGRPFTLPSGKYQYGNSTVSYYTERNEYRLAPYHRLDLALNIDFNQTGKFKSSMNISLYNVYGRKNPYTVIVRDKESGEGKELVMIYLFRWLPSITYNFSF